jgi:hypothetical protein
MDKNAICPHYIKETKGSVYCEAGRIRPKDNGMRKELIYDRCAGDWESCQMRLALEHYYERNEKETFN